MAAVKSDRADAVFEGGGVKGIAFAGAIAAAERDAGVKEWVNVAGTSAGAIVAALLVVGYDAAGLQRILSEAKYARFADTGAGGKWIGGLGKVVFRLRGMAQATTSSSGWASNWLRRRSRRSWARPSSPSATSNAICRPRRS